MTSKPGPISSAVSLYFLSPSLLFVMQFAPRLPILSASFCQTFFLFPWQNKKKEKRRRRKCRERLTGAIPISSEIDLPRLFLPALLDISKGQREGQVVMEELDDLLSFIPCTRLASQMALRHQRTRAQNEVDKKVLNFMRDIESMAWKWRTFCSIFFSLSLRKTFEYLFSIGPHFITSAP